MRLWPNRFGAILSGALSLDTELRITGELYIKIERFEGERYRWMSVPLQELSEFVLDPEDGSQIMYVRRQWTAEGEQRQAWYPIWYEDRPETMAEVLIGKNGEPLPVNSDAYLIHGKIGTFIHWPFGLNEFYTTHKWSAEYSDFLGSVAKVMRVLSQFAVRGKTKGTLERFYKGLEATLDKTATPGLSSAKQDVIDRTIATQPGAEIEAFQVRGANVEPNDGRRIELMVAAGMGISDIYFDSETANYAIGNVVERASEIGHTARQEFWSLLIKECMEAFSELTGETMPDDFEVSFPDISEHDTQAMVQAINVGSAHLSQETAVRLTAMELGVKDVEAEVERFKEEEEERQQRGDEMRLAMMNAASDDPEEDEQDESEEDVPVAESEGDKKFRYTL